MVKVRRYEPTSVAVGVALPVLGRSAHHATFPVAYLYRVLEYYALVRVKRLTVFERAVLLASGQVPVHGHLYVVPFRGVEVGFVKVLRALIGVRGPVELPFAIERLPERAVFGQHLACLVDVGKREEPRVWLLLVVGHRVRALPFPSGGGGHLSVEVASERRYLCP